MDIDFKKYINDFKIEKRSVEGFWKNIISYRVEHPKEFGEHFSDFDEGLLTVNIQQISFTLNNWPDYATWYITSYIPIIYEGKIIGVYKMLFNFLGEVDDDYFIIY